VIGEWLVTPSLIVYLVIKLRLSPPSSVKVEKKVLNVEETKRSVWMNEEKDNQFLISRQEVEDLEGDDVVGGWAHAPDWPEVSFVNHTLIFL
jgi:translocation protein SEC63